MFGLPPELPQSNSTIRINRVWPYLVPIVQIAILDDIIFRQYEVFSATTINSSDHWPVYPFLNGLFVITMRTISHTRNDWLGSIWNWYVVHVHQEIELVIGHDVWWWHSYRSVPLYFIWHSLWSGKYECNCVYQQLCSFVLHWHHPCVLWVNVDTREKKFVIVMYAR